MIFERITEATQAILGLPTAIEPRESDEGRFYFAQTEPGLVHPTALASFVDYLLHARDRVQFMVTTHSPLLLDYLNEPEAVRVVQRSEQGTTVVTGENPGNVRKALEASGFGLGAFYETKGFGSN